MIFQIIRYRTVKNRFACNSMIPDTWRKCRIIGRIQRMASNTRNGDHIHIPLEPCVHCPENIIHVKAVHIFIYEEYIFQLTERGKGKKCSLTLSALITWRKFLKLKNSHIFPPPALLQYTF